MFKPLADSWKLASHLHPPPTTDHVETDQSLGSCGAQNHSVSRPIEDRLVISPSNDFAAYIAALVNPSISYITLLRSEIPLKRPRKSQNGDCKDFVQYPKNEKKPFNLVDID